MIEHANSAPTTVNEQSRIDLAMVSAFATGLIVLTEQSEEMDVFDLYEIVQRHARESYDGDYDMNDVDEIFGPFDVDEFVEATDRDVDLNEVRAEEFLGNFSQESIEAGRPTTVEEALNMPIAEISEIVDDGGYLEGILEDSLEEYVRTASVFA